MPLNLIGYGERACSICVYRHRQYICDNVATAAGWDVTDARVRVALLLLTWM